MKLLLALLTIREVFSCCLDDYEDFYKRLLGTDEIEKRNLTTPLYLTY